MSGSDVNNTDILKESERKQFCNNYRNVTGFERGIVRGMGLYASYPIGQNMKHESVISPIYGVRKMQHHWRDIKEIQGKQELMASVTCTTT
jgi:hypothetical protein